MKEPKVIVGMISGGEASAFTARSMVDMARSTPWPFFSPVVGSVITHNLCRLTSDFLDTDGDVLLRIDSDTVWSDAFVPHFRRSLAEVAKRAKRRPYIVGAVVPKRRRAQHYGPAIRLPEDSPVAEGQRYATWVRLCYERGATVPVVGVGGAFTAYSRSFLELFGPAGWRFGYAEGDRPWEGESEDFGACRVCLDDFGGSVTAVFPLLGQAEMCHWNGTEVITVRDFLVQAQVHGIDIQEKQDEVEKHYRPILEGVTA